MESNELQDWLNRWGLQPSDGAKVLQIQKSKMSEYLSGTRKVPNYISAHIETLDNLADLKATRLIKKRLE
ncbi:hypothetical protein [Reinekea sp. G2M2-21]|uniref:hypothetical protein n=1 Tax=Reinekea sp. G2M2-21 TaxID=2788942 RepID=UPI0018A944CA|nr:hypothetical protein [Reinekea sp. G2M2-21]